jgi:Divergent InlB B-repeat domain
MSSREGALTAPLRIVLALAALTAFCFFTAQAQAAPGSYKVLLAEVYEVGAKRLQAQVASFPDVAKVDLVDTGEVTPTAAELRAYDVVVSIGDSNYLDQEAWGNALADYVGTGGIVIQSAYDTWNGGGAPTGRWESGGYPALIPGDNVNNATTLGAFDNANPLMQGVAPGSLTTEEYNTENEPSSGATVIARWADGRPAIAVKGRAIGISSFIGDDYDAPGEPAWTGNYGQIIVNAARALTPQPLSVVNANAAGGTVTSTVGGISCGSACAAAFTYGAQVGLAATANKGFAFAGYAGACAGTTCALTMDGPKAVTANFIPFNNGKVKRNKKKGTATLTVNVGAPGQVLVSSKKTKERSKSANAAGNVKLPIIPKGKALKALKKKGKAKVQVKVAYTPTGGVTSILTRKIQLKLETD